MKWKYIFQFTKFTRNGYFADIFDKEEKESRDVYCEKCKAYQKIIEGSTIIYMGDDISGGDFLPICEPCYRKIIEVLDQDEYIVQYEE